MIQEWVQIEKEKGELIVSKGSEFRGIWGLCQDYG